MKSVLTRNPWRTLFWRNVLQKQMVLGRPFKSNPFGTLISKSAGRWQHHTQTHWHHWNDAAVKTLSYQIHLALCISQHRNQSVGSDLQAIFSIVEKIHLVSFHPCYSWISTALEVCSLQSRWKEQGILEKNTSSGDWLSLSGCSEWQCVSLHIPMDSLCLYHR